MTEAELFEKIGRQHAEIEARDNAFAKTLSVLAGVVKGEIAPSRVLVNLTARSWSVAPEGLSPEMPATINGLPQCVVGPAESEADRLRAQLATAEEAVKALDAEVVRLTILQAAAAAANGTG